MGNYVTAMGGHDAEWLLQNERVYNDRIVQQARAGRRPMSKPHLRDVGKVTEACAEELQAAARFVRRKVNGEAAGEVLAMLGLET